MNSTTLTADELLAVINKTKNDTKNGLCDVFITKLERLAAHIRAGNLNRFEAAELLENEAEAMRNQHYEDMSNA